MKKLFITFFLVLLIPSLVVAANFTPTQLKLIASENIHYDFDGSTLNIPVTVTGTAARTWFFVFTKGKAADIVEVNNGYLGWHWVNQLDTCVYMSQPNDFGTGQQTITWNGKDDDGNVVPLGDDYTYYMWAYDYLTPPESIQATPDKIGFAAGMWVVGIPHLQEKDEQGLPLSQPFFSDYLHWKPDESYTEKQYWVMKWTFGQDPLNPDLIETTDVKVEEAWDHSATGGNNAPNPYDFSKWYFKKQGADYAGVKLQRFTWVPNDLAVFDTEWGYESNECTANLIGPFSDGNYLYWSVSHDMSTFPCTKDYIMDFDGEIVQSWQKDRWILVDEFALWGYTLNAGPIYGTMRDGYMFQGTCFTLQGMLDPIRSLETGNYPDAEAWINKNGDYVIDRCFEPDSTTPWYNGGESAPYPVSIYSDANYFYS